jgi:hypothetical protein
MKLLFGTVHGCWLVIFLNLVVSSTHAAALKTKNVLLIMTDGLRWQEVFTGAEERLMGKEFGNVKDTNALRRDFWRDTPGERRAALMPFFWTEIARRGQLYGNQHQGSAARVTNGKNFSYPGYSEILTGHVDARIDSNAKKPNPNISVLEWFNNQPAFQGKVFAYANWDVVPFILNRERSKLPVWTGLEKTTSAAKDPLQAQLEQLAADTTPLWTSMTLDVFIHHAALSRLRSGQPRLMYICYGETDEWAHEGRYDHYLRSAHNVDRFIRQLWETVQAMPQYRDQTTLLITTDHGRGTDNISWRSHGQSISESGAIWIAALGPDTLPLGERMNTPSVFQNQIAATVAKLLGKDYRQAVPEAGEPLADLLPSGK